MKDFILTSEIIEYRWYTEIYIFSFFFSTPPFLSTVRYMARRIHDPPSPAHASAYLNLFWVNFLPIFKKKFERKNFGFVLAF